MPTRTFLRCDKLPPRMFWSTRLWVLVLIVGLVTGVQLTPGSWLQPAQLAALALAAVLGGYWRGLRTWMLLLIALLGGLGYGQVAVQQLVAQQAVLGEPTPARLLLRIDAMSSADPRRQRLTATVLAPPGAISATGVSGGLRTGARLRLSWFDGPAMATGERWQLQLVLRPVHGLRNPGGFDYQQWLLANRIVATGSIRAGHRVQSASRLGRSGLRARLRDRLSVQPHGGLLLALLLGDRSQLDSLQMALVRVTGTVHLLVVSGLHISMVAGIGALAGRGIGQVLGALLLRGDMRWFSAVAALLLSLGYVVLAGATVPALRAFLMTLIGALLLASGRLRSASTSLLWVLLGLLLINPLAALGSGIWLSFGAVALLLGYWSPRSRRHWLMALPVTQALLSLGSAMLLNQFGNPVAPAAPVANLLAVPLITVAVVPVALLGAVAGELQLWPAKLLLDTASELLGVLWQWLELWADSPLWYPQRPSMLAISGLVASLVLLLRVVGGWSLLAVLAGLSVLWISSARPIPPGEFRVLVLDVGQGSAALVRTHGHSLLFDAAPAYPGGRDLGSDVVVPSLLQLGVRRLDALVVSHDDSDHAGGAAAVANALGVGKFWRSSAYDPVTGVNTAQPCRAGRRWQWDQVRFEFLHPSAPAQGSVEQSAHRRAGNEQSCMLRISSAQAAALLTGDTGRASERVLVRSGLLAADLVVVPHHGSAGSSDRAFVRLLRPRVAIASAGRFNQYGHPRASVRDRYEAVGAVFVVTAESGAALWSSQRPATVVTLSGGDRAGQ